MFFQMRTGGPLVSILPTRLQIRVELVSIFTAGICMSWCQRSLHRVPADYGTPHVFFQNHTADSPEGPKRIGFCSICVSNARRPPENCKVTTKSAKRMYQAFAQTRARGTLALQRDRDAFQPLGGWRSRSMLLTNHLSIFDVYLNIAYNYKK